MRFGPAQRRWLLGGVAFLAAALLTKNSDAQVITMKDGKTVTAKSLRRQGDLIMATQESVAPDGKSTGGTVEMGYQISAIQKINFPEPAQLKAAAELLNQGRGPDAVAQLDAALRYYEGFRDAPGSWWADLALLKSQALVSLGREKEAEPMVAQIAQLATNPETVRAAKAQIAAGLTRRGEHQRALEMCEEILKESTKPETIAAAAMSKGQSHLALKQYEDAALSFLQVPVFYPDAKVLVPAALLGVARAHFGMEDLTRAKATLNELIATYGATPDAAAAKVELEKVAKLEKALAPPEPAK